ncbi:MAG TPA: stealth family protein [Cellvibrio sp.]|nr:stealth family protein [Cellvibrio sp.]
MLNNSNTENAIDAVITWVDGSDPAHKKKLEAYLQQIGDVRHPSADPTRFNDAGEIEYCVAALLRFTPWIRHIYIVTDAQRPKLIQKIIGTPYEGRVKIVDHRDIFAGYEACLPTFNSSSILPMLWRIPGLSENFLFLNDDFFIIRELNPSDFFRDDKVVLRGNWHKFSENLWYKRLAKYVKSLFVTPANHVRPKRAGFLAGQELSAKLVGFKDKYFRVPHNPHAWRVSTQAKYFSANPMVLQNSIKFRLRSPEQFIGESLAAHLELINGNAIVDKKLKTIQIKPASQLTRELQLRLWWADVDSSCAFMCVQSLERGSGENQKMVIEWLNRRIGSLDRLLLGKE